MSPMLHSFLWHPIMWEFLVLSVAPRNCHTGPSYGMNQCCAAHSGMLVGNRIPHLSDVHACAFAYIKARMDSRIQLPFGLTLFEQPTRASSTRASASAPRRRTHRKPAPHQSQRTQPHKRGQGTGLAIAAAPPTSCRGRVLIVSLTRLETCLTGCSTSHGAHGQFSCARTAVTSLWAYFPAVFQLQECTSHCPHSCLRRASMCPHPHLTIHRLTHSPTPLHPPCENGAA